MKLQLAFIKSVYIALMVLSVTGCGKKPWALSIEEMTHRSDLAALYRVDTNSGVVRYILVEVVASRGDQSKWPRLGLEPSISGLMPVETNSYYGDYALMWHRYDRQQRSMQHTYSVAFSGGKVLAENRSQEDVISTVRRLMAGGVQGSVGDRRRE